MDKPVEGNGNQQGVAHGDVDTETEELEPAKPHQPEDVGYHQHQVLTSCDGQTMGSNEADVLKAAIESPVAQQQPKQQKNYQQKALKLLFLPGPALSIFNGLETDRKAFLNPPSNFAVVAPGIFRSSFPRVENFEFLESLRLKTVLTLVQEDYPEILVQHYAKKGIKLIQFKIPGNKEPFVHIPEDKIRIALRKVLDTRNHPILIHCNKGKHRTGCLVGCLRKLQNWSSTAIFDEYRRYAFPKSRNMDQQFIELFDHSAVWEEIEVKFKPTWLEL
ncbi:tyrosine phosphatase family-domain-containing protein [Phakopsora pachyrhizi]|nr:tyrosine phosphatase family-domain-containing protein [Phakopsora pachyrhizi]KAI8446810.1 tyrosine phosphatase family-domain-containing protein [Phakopsora pachyrhizi]